MRVRTLSLLAGTAVPLILTGSAPAGFVGISTVSKPNPFGVGLFTVNVYAIFDRPDPGDGSGDHMIAVAGTPDAPMNITVIGGVFYNSPFGRTTAPSAPLLVPFPSLAYDTFLTIGVKAVGDPPFQPFDDLIISPEFPNPGLTGNFLGGPNLHWAVIPTNPQGDPFNPEFVNGNGQTLIGQFSTADGTAISGTMLLGYVSNGLAHQTIETFFVPGPGGLPALALFCALGARRRRRG